MQCPKCSRELFEVEQDLVTIDCCPGCHGLWFDRGELEKITGVDDALAKLSAGVPTELTCPRCAKPLHEYATDEAIGVNAERCRDCGGIWLDRGELHAFKKRERSHTRERPPSQPQVLTLKEFLLKFVDSSIDSLLQG
jgi:Zn-finger nucleic acid-binding protein